MTDLENMRHEIDDINNEIDNINNEIVSVISKRINIAKRIAKHKKENNIPIIDKQREENVISFFEEKFVDRGMKLEAERVLARALIDYVIEEERHLINRK